MNWLKQNWFRTTLVVIITISVFFIYSNYSNADVWVNGYTRSNGTYVQGHYRSSPDGNPYNNYSYPGNTNPYTGVTAPGNPDTYLKNYYDDNGSSYYGGSSTYGTTPTYPIWTPTPIPSCPFMSSYNSLSGTCQCYSGYVSDGSSCVSGLTYCWDKYGYNSSYNSLDKSCECDSGYELKYGTCTRIQKTVDINYPLYFPTLTPTPTPNFSLLCQQEHGTESRYNSVTEKCEYCNSGYRLVGGKCYPIATGSPLPSTGTGQSEQPKIYGITTSAEGVQCIEAVTYLGKTIEPLPGLSNWTSLGITFPPCNWYGNKNFVQYHKPGTQVPTPSQVTASIAKKCDTGFSLSLNSKNCIRVPNNAHIANDGKNVWLCDSGYTEKGNICIINTSAPTPAPTISKSNKSFWSKAKFW